MTTTTAESGTRTSTPAAGTAINDGNLSLVQQPLLPPFSEETDETTLLDGMHRFVATVEDTSINPSINSPKEPPPLPLLEALVELNAIFTGEKTGKEEQEEEEDSDSESDSESVCGSDSSSSEDEEDSGEEEEEEAPLSEDEASVAPPAQNQNQVVHSNNNVEEPRGDYPPVPVLPPAGPPGPNHFQIQFQNRVQRLLEVTFREPPTTNQQLERQQQQQQKPKRQERLEPTQEQIITDRTRAIELLQMHPVLASELFEDCYYPLEYLIADFQAPLSVVKTVYQLAPVILHDYTNRKHQRTVLHNVCYYGANNEEGSVIAYLAHQYPGAVDRPDDRGYLPIHLLMKHVQHHEPIETLQALLTIFPQSIFARKVECNSDNNHVPLMPLQYALRADYPLYTLQYLFGRVPKDIDVFSITEDWHGRPYRSSNLEFASFLNESVDDDIFILNQNSALGIAALLPQLEEFSCLAQRWTIQGFHQLLTDIGNNTSISKLELRMSKDMICHGQQGGGHVDTAETALQFRECFHKNTTIQHLTLRDGYGPFLWTVQYALDSLVYLKLCNFVLDDQHSRALSDILSDKRAPREIVLLHIQLLGDYLPCNFADRPGYTCPITKLDVTLYPAIDTRAQRHSNDYIDGLLSDIRHASNLKELRLCIHRGDDGNTTDIPWSNQYNHPVGSFLHNLPKNITKRICAIVRKNILTTLYVVCGFYVELSKMIRILRNNTSLKTYYVIANDAHGTTKEHGEKLVRLLKHKNTTLECIDSNYRDSSLQQLIWYYTHLNCFGRRSIRRANGMTLHEFVDTLARVPKDRSVQDNSMFQESLKPSMLQYGLLREMPSLWCHAAAATGPGATPATGGGV